MCEKLRNISAPLLVALVAVLSSGTVPAADGKLDLAKALQNGKIRLRDSKNLSTDKVLYLKGETLNFTLTGLKAGAACKLVWYDAFNRVGKIEDLKIAGDPHKGTLKVDYPTTILNWLLVVTVDAKGNARVAASKRFGVRPKKWWDDYAVMKYRGRMKSYHDYMDAGIFGTGCYGGDYAVNNMRRYIGEIIRDLYFHKIFVKTYSSPYEKTREKKHMIRRPCNNNPEEMKTRFGATYFARRALAAARITCPWAVDLRDEPGYTSMGNPFDFCFCEHCIKRFRGWIKKEYKDSLDDLNKQWGSSFKSWDTVMPDTIDEAKMKHTPFLKGKLVPGVGRFELTSEQFSEPGSENFSALYDRIQFVDEHYAELIENLYKKVNDQIPETHVGLVGTQAPLAWSGWNWPLLLKKMTWAEPYDWGGSRDVIRSMAVPGFRFAKTTFGTSLGTKYTIWRYFLLGDDGAILWDYGRNFRNTFHEFHDGLAKLMIKSEVLTEPIAIIYSQPSIRVHWMLDSEVDASTWPRRYGSYEGGHSCILGSRVSWMKAVEDNGLFYKFVDRTDVAADALIKRGYKVVILPKTCAMSAETAEAIKRFVKQGGVVIADNMTATFDHHGKRLKEGLLDKSFGIKRENFVTAEVNGYRCPKQSHIQKATNKKWLDIAMSPVTLKKADKHASLLEGVGAEELHIVEPAIKAEKDATVLAEAGGAPALIVREEGKGKFIYTNISWLYYRNSRLNSEKKMGPNLRKLTENILALAGVKKPIQVLDPKTGKDLHVVQRFRYKRGKMDLFGLAVNARVKQDDLGNMRISGLDVKNTLPFRVKLPEKRHVYDVRRRAYLGEVDQFDYQMVPVEGFVFAALPYKVSGFDVEVGADHPHHFKATVKADKQPFEHVVHVEVFDPRGVCRENYCLNLNAPGGVAEGDIPLCANDPAGKWTVVFRDVVSGLTVIKTIEKKGAEHTGVATKDSYANTGVVLSVRKQAFELVKLDGGKMRAQFRIAVERVDKSFADGEVLFSAKDWTCSKPKMSLFDFDVLSEHTTYFTMSHEFTGIEKAPHSCPIVMDLRIKGKEPKQSAYTFSFLPLFNEKAPVLDGDISEDAWKKARPLTEFLVAGKPAPLKSEARLLLAGDDLFFSIKNALPEGKQPTIGKHWRDSGNIPKQDDAVTIEIRPKAGEGLVYVLGLNAAGKQFDSLGGKGSYNFKWYRRTKSAAGSWQAELRIPLAVFKKQYQKGEQDTWAFKLTVNRRIDKKQTQQAVFMGDVFLGAKR